MGWPQHNSMQNWRKQENYEMRELNNYDIKKGDKRVLSEFDK